MLICHFDQNEKGTVNSIMDLFTTYADSNTETKEEEQKCITVPFPKDHLSGYASIGMLSEKDEPKLLERTECVWSTPLVSCSMIMMYDAKQDKTLVYHAPGGVVSEEWTDCYQKYFEGGYVLIITPLFTPNASLDISEMKETVYYRGAQYFNELKCPWNRICMIDGTKLAGVVCMTGDGKYFAT